MHTLEELIDSSAHALAGEIVEAVDLASVGLDTPQMREFIENLLSVQITNAAITQLSMITAMLTVIAEGK